MADAPGPEGGGPPEGGWSGRAQPDGLPPAPWWSADGPTTGPPPPGVVHRPVTPRVDRDAWLAAIFGVLAILCCGLPFAPFAIYWGNRARRRIRANRRILRGDDLALAGVILGWFSLAQLAVVALVVFA